MSRSPLGFDTGQASISGDYREGNEDSLYTSSWSAFVADGVGGHAAGEVASATIAIRLASMLDATEGRLPGEARLRELVAIANADLALRVRMNSALRGMATTLVGLFSDGQQVLVAHSGDSRAYRLRDGLLTQVTEDDSLVRELVSAGAIAEEEVSRHPLRSVVTHVLGGDPEDAAALHVSAEPLRHGDRWLLTSDGLTDYVPLQEIADELAAAATPQDAADALGASALRHRARDNVSVVVADVIPLVAVPVYRPVFGGSAAADPASARTLDG